MKARKPAAMLGVAAILGLSLAVGAVLPANAVSLWPKGFQPRQMMINVLSSVLASAGGDSPAKRAVIAASQTYDHSWEGLEQQWKLSSKGAPNSYEDYVLDKQKYFADNNMTSIPGEVSHPNNQKKYVKNAKMPATRATQLAKAGVGIGLGVGAGIGFEYRADIANGATGIFGVDGQGAVCGMDEDEFGVATGFVNWLSGQDCSAWEIDDEFVPNTDAEGTGFTMNLCHPAYGGCIDYKGLSITRNGSTDYHGVYACFGGKASNNWPSADQPIVYFKNASGRYLAQYIYTAELNSNSCGGSGGSAQMFYGEYRSSSEAALSKIEIQCLSRGVYNPGPNACDGIPAADRADITPVSGDPQRVLTCTVVGTDGKTYTQDTPVYSQTADAVPEPECPVLPEGVGVDGVKVDEVNKETGQATPLLDEETTNEYRQWWQAYPECREGACSLDLVKKDKQTSCFDSIAMADSCQEWIKDPNRTRNYQCMYGTHLVDLSECYAYADVFYPEKVAAGEAYSDPKTGESVKGQSSPKAANRALSRAITDPRDMTGCLDTGWSKANPVEWVMVPVQCSLQWAFAPSAKVMEVAGLKMQNDWNKKPPAQVVNAVSNWSFAPTAAGCSTPIELMGRTIVMADACPGGNAEGLAKLARVVGVAVFVVLDVIFLRRMTEKSVDA